MRIKNARTFNLLLFIELQQTLSFPFSLLRHYQMPECFYVNKLLFLSSCNSSLMLQKLVM